MSDTIFCEINDNGIGITESQRINNIKRKNHKSHGLEITKQRLQLLKGKRKLKDHLLITEIINANLVEGTNVMFNFPVNYNA